MKPKKHDENELIDFRTDIYSFGATAVDWITGQEPFGDSDLVQVISVLQDCYKTGGRAIDVRKINEEKSLKLPENVVCMLEKMTHPNPNDRYQSMDEVIEDFGHLINREKTINAMNKFIEEIEKGQARGHLPEPTLLRMIYFKIFKAVSELNPDAIADYEYYKDKSEYYYPKIKNSTSCSNQTRHHYLNVYASVS